MKTDKQLYQIFRAWPELIFLLARLRAPAGCKVSSVTVKALQRSMDGLVTMTKKGQPIVVLEIQFYKSRNIFNRLIVEMSLVQEEHNMRMVRGLIFFGRRSLDPGIEPWASSGLIQVVYLDEELERLEAEQPEHPLVAVLKPLFEESAKKLEKEASVYYRRLQKSAVLQPAQREGFCEVFFNLLSQRLRNKTNQEIAMILNLPDIEDTACGKGLLDKGRKSELTKVLLTQAELKFGSLDDRTEQAIAQLGLEDARALVSDLLKLRSAGALRRWLAEHPASQKASKGRTRARKSRKIPSRLQASETKPTRKSP